MALTIAVPKEEADGEHRVALVPSVAAKLVELGAKVRIQRGAGEAAGFPDDAYEAAEVVDGDSLYRGAGVVLCVRPPSADVLDRLEEGTILVGFLAPHASDALVKKAREGKLSTFAVELIPRISRAQSMDALSSQAAAAGYKAALIAADHARFFFPMLTTAAGTVRPATVLVIGAGVAGLQAIATARRLGAQVEGYDVRPETEEQVKSLGAKFLKLDVAAGGEGGYARELTEEEKQKQQQMLGEHLAKVNVVITTAAVPGRPAPKILTKDMIAHMKPGSVIVDLAAEGGGNCELTKPGELVDHDGVMIDGPLNLPSRLAVHASEMYAKNLLNFLSPVIEEGEIRLDFEDQVIADSCVTHDGEIRHEATRERLGGDQG